MKKNLLFLSLFINLYFYVSVVSAQTGKVSGKHASQLKYDYAAQGLTRFGPGAGDYARMLDSLKKQLARSVRSVFRNGSERTMFTDWIRDHVHVMKAMKYFVPDLKSYLEYFLEEQTPEGMYYDYCDPIDDWSGCRLALFDKRYWKVDIYDKVQLHRLPLEADVEYLVVEGAYQYWQATGDTAFIRKWMPNLEKGLEYSMSDPLRWSAHYGLVKRAYTLDTWDFMYMPWTTTDDPVRDMPVIEEEIMKFVIGPSTPMGIMHGDNSGMYAACRQLAILHRVLGNPVNGQIWDMEAEQFRVRANNLLWNGKYYAHFKEIDPPPANFPKIDQKNILSLSNPYDINRGLPTEEMAESIIQTYLDLKEKTKNESFAEWFSIYPAIHPNYGGFPPGTYVNGGILTIVAGELAKAAFQHGYEAYGVDILNRVSKLMDKHKGRLPVVYHPDGSVDKYIPNNWGQAAVYSALVEGLAGVVDKSILFETAEVSPRWLAAGIDDVDAVVAYGPNGKRVRYVYNADRAAGNIRLELEGDAKQYRIRFLLPKKVNNASAKVGDQTVPVEMETIRASQYAVLDKVTGGHVVVELKYLE